MKRLDGYAAIITGGTGGLGTAVLSVFLSEGARVSVTYIKDRELARIEDLAEKYGSQLNIVRANVTEAADVVKVVGETVNKFGSVDILVNIVGGFAMSAITETDEELWDRMMNMNLKSVYLTSRAVVPQMMEQKSGRIVNIGARPALKGSANMSAYGASKAGVLNLTQSMADELSEHNINVNAIIPGTMNTPGNRASMPDADQSKWVDTEEIARVIVFLCSEDANAISGAVVPVYGKT